MNRAEAEEITVGTLISYYSPDYGHRRYAKVARVDMDGIWGNYKSNKKSALQSSVSAESRLPWSRLDRYDVQIEKVENWRDII